MKSKNNLIHWPEGIFFIIHCVYFFSLLNFHQLSKTFGVVLSSVSILLDIYFIQFNTKIKFEENPKKFHSLLTISIGLLFLLNFQNHLLYDTYKVNAILFSISLLIHLKFHKSSFATFVRL